MKIPSLAPILSLVDASDLMVLIWESSQPCHHSLCPRETPGN